MNYYFHIIPVIGLLFLILNSVAFAGTKLPAQKAVAVYTPVAPKIDGKVDKIWLKAPIQRGFVQREPEQGEDATNDTRFYVLYDDENIYLLFVMLDGHSRSIPARLVDRDYKFGPDDNINFYLDTYNDSRKAFFFSTNPLGVEQDGLISENGENVDMTWDGIFKVEASVNKYGWIAEFSIPYKTLRFKDNLRYQVWGFNAWRIRKENREMSYWSLVDQNYQSFRLDKGGILVGMKNVSSGQNLRFLPYYTVRNSHPGMNPQKSQFTGGLDAKYNLTSDLTLDMTLNPDFGQVEIDEEQINLDKRFEIQLEEKRPFFLESTNLFQMPYYQLFYSRRIGAQSDIKGGAKLTGKAGPYSIGVLEALTGDWNNFGIGDPNQPPVDELFSVARVQRDIFSSSNVGAMFVDRQANAGGVDSHSSWSGSMDWNMYSGQRYFVGQAVYSRNSASNEKGGALYGEAGRYGQMFWFDAVATYYEPNFNLNNTGYFLNIPGKGKRQFGLYADVHPLINRSFVRSWGISLKPIYTRDSDESAAGYGLQSTAWIETRDQSQLKIGFTRYRDAETDLYYYAFSRFPENELVYWGRDLFAEASTDPGKPVSGTIRWNWDTQYYFQTHSTGYNEGIEASVRVVPVPNASLELEHERRWFFNRNMQRIPVAVIGQSDNRIWALRGRYLFTKNFFSRLFFQYTNGAEGAYYNNAGMLRYFAWRRLSGNAMLGWRFQPGSTIYLAYTHEWDNFATTKLKSANHILYFKFSYFWSL